MKSNFLVVLVSLVFALSVTIHAQDPATSQSWTSKDGRTIQAKFVKLVGEAVVVEKGGEEITIPFSKLSAASVISARRMGEPATGREKSEEIPGTASKPQIKPTVPSGHQDKPVKVSAATKDDPFTNSLGMKFAPVQVTDRSSASRRLLFCIWETRVKDFGAFVAGDSSYRYDLGSAPWVVEKGNIRQNPEASWNNPGFKQMDDHPVTCVSWEDAVAFCRWLTKVEGNMGRIGQKDEYRLPTDAEWSWAVGIGDRESAGVTPKKKSKGVREVYPWGTQWPPPQGAANHFGEETKAAFPGFEVIAGYNDGYVTTSPGGSFAANRFGLFDLAGNVWEFCGDFYDGNSGNPVIRGGSWNSSIREEVLSSSRASSQPGYRNSSTGFRCVLEFSGR